MFNHGYVKAAIANTINCKIGNPKHNANILLQIMSDAKRKSVKLLIFPELSITGYTCQDMFFNSQLLEQTTSQLIVLSKYMPQDILVVVGAPLSINDTLFNCAVVMFNNKIVGIVPKQYIPTHNEFYEKRWFSSPADSLPASVKFNGYDVPLGNIVFMSNIGFKLGIEICQDLWSVIPPSSYLSLAGANIIANLSASNELVGKDSYLKELIKIQSAKTISAYLYTSSNFSESTSDLVFGGSGYAFENGKILSISERYETKKELNIFDIDVEYLSNERRVNKTFTDSKRNLSNFTYSTVSVEYSHTIKCADNPNIKRTINPHPFIPDEKDKDAYDSVCNEIINIQSIGLAQRLKAINCNTAILGISGGLDSTLALLVTVEAFKKLDLDLKNIITVTMPCFGTTSRTYTNAVELCKGFGTTFREISIADACIQHFKDIGLEPDIHDVTYENAQARERTQILMDIANKEGALVVGTGDLSELMLGWCTYNGDHMSMYGVNANVPKTLIKAIIEWYCGICDHDLSEILDFVVNGNISPELLPTDGKKVVQKTEDSVGPYEVIDFFIYNFLRKKYSAEKILFLAEVALSEKYSSEEITKYYNNFINRFFKNQFKRSCLPDGPKVGSVGVSSKGDLLLPSDIKTPDWLK